MKTVQINKVKVRIFEEEDLKEKLNFNNEQITLIMEHQRKFPELLQNGIEGYCIDARNLHSKLVENVKVDKDGETKKGDTFSQWISRRIKKYSFVENRDFTNVHKFVNVKFTQEEVSNMNSQQRSRYGITTEYNITLEMAKQLCMLENNEIGHNSRMYFIYMEQALRDMKQWTEVREPEKQNANEMKSYIADWCDRMGYDKTTENIYQREFNMLNENLTGFTAQGLKYHIGYKDIQTREHLDTKVNQALHMLQQLNISLLLANMSFEDRINIVRKTCNAQYSNLKMK